MINIHTAFCCRHFLLILFIAQCVAFRFDEVDLWKETLTFLVGILSYLSPHAPSTIVYVATVYVPELEREMGKTTFNSVPGTV